MIDEDETNAELLAERRDMAYREWRQLDSAYREWLRRMEHGYDCGED